MSPRRPEWKLSIEIYSPAWGRDDRIIAHQNDAAVTRRKIKRCRRLGIWREAAFRQNMRPARAEAHRGKLDKMA